MSGPGRKKIRFPQKTSWAHGANRTRPVTFVSLSEKEVLFIMSLAHFMTLGFAALGKAASSPLRSLLLGTEASRSCPALLPLDWNVNKPAGKTKTQPSAVGRRGARLAGWLRGAHRACPSFPGRSCSPGWSPLSHTSHLCPFSCSCFSGGEK